MNDPLGIFASILFAVVALCVLFRRGDLKWRGFWVVLLCSLIIIVLTRDRLTELFFSYKQMQIGVRLEKVETQIIDIATAMETLIVAQRVDKLDENNSFLLEYEPIPQSVRIIVGPLVQLPRPEYGYRMEGRRIYVDDPVTLKQIANRRAITVEYFRRVRTEDIIR